MNRKRILVVDDEPIVTRTLKLSLEAEGRYEVGTENDPDLALGVAHKFHPHVILLDVMMPRLDGCALSSRIHSDPELERTPIIFLTALAHNENTGGHAVITCSRVYLAKPVNTDELIECIEQRLA